jgi:hypothetical protein
VCSSDLVWIKLGGPIKKGKLFFFFNCDSSIDANVDSTHGIFLPLNTVGQVTDLSTTETGQVGHGGEAAH